MKPLSRSHNRPVTAARRFARLYLERLEARDVPSAAFDRQTIAVGFRTGDAGDSVVPHLVSVRPGQTVDDAIAQWRKYGIVAYAEPNYTFTTAAIPNDPYAGLLYAQNNTGQSGGLLDADMDAPEAWDLTTGSLRTVVAVIDTGIDYNHPDLYRNIWVNQSEIPSAVRALLTDTDGDGLITFADLNSAVNIGPGRITDLNGDGYIDGGDILKPIAQGGWADGLDEGANGYTDDLIGWDFVGNDNNPMDVVAEDGGHGTHVAGTIGAMGNNGVGVVGVAWGVQLMPVRFLGLGGGSSVAAANAIRYSATNGAVVSNNSWGSSGYSQTIFDAINYARGKGEVFVAAAGNQSANNDTTAFYPANFALDNIVSVAATDRFDQLASFSNYGRTTVDLAAAGVDIASTYPGNQYAYMSGTSMATPQVTGALALLRSREPTLTYSQVISRLLNNVDPIPAVGTITISGGRLNAYKALAAEIVDRIGPAVTAMTPNATGTSLVSAVRITFSEAVDASTFTATDVTATGPAGAAVAITGLVPVGTAGTQFDITFAAQSTPGTYTVRVGPGVADRSGNLMDQDRDGVNGEAGQDVFAGTFAIDAPSASATFVRTDVATQGDWQKAYGADGYHVLGGASNGPAYATITPAGQSSWVWAGSTADARALTNPAGSHVAACWYAGDSFNVTVGLADGQMHQVALYLLDWDGGGTRGERVDVTDASGRVLDTRTASGFQGGQYLVWTVSGTVNFRFTRMAGVNAVLSGLFFGGPPQPSQPPQPPSTSATFVRTDAATQGDWQKAYGADGYNVLGGATSAPTYVGITPAGQSSWVWTGSSTDARALTNPAGGRVAACWYAGGSFDVTVSVTDGLSHQVALYLLDWDGGARSERIDVLDASGQVLDSRTASGFQGGQYLVWTVSGTVTFRFTNLSGPNAVLSGLFFGGPSR